MTIKGGCLCGRVRYEIDGPLFDASHCHCSMCRRQHGAAFATYAQFDPGHFRWVAGEDRVKSYEADGGGGWWFCADCGSSLAGSEGGTIGSITLGSVDGDPGLRPASHIFVASRAGWDEITDDIPQYDEWGPRE